jgi:hypothetical protein
MGIRKENKRAQSILNLKQQSELSYLVNKYNKSESKILAIALELLAAQDRAGFDIPKLKK